MFEKDGVRETYSPKKTGFLLKEVRNRLIEVEYEMNSRFYGEEVSPEEIWSIGFNMGT